jgi:hypothetical protein
MKYAMYRKGGVNGEKIFYRRVLDVCLYSLYIQCNSNCKSGPSKLAVVCFKTQDTELRLTVKYLPVKIRYMNVKFSMAETTLILP